MHWNTHEMPEKFLIAFRSAFPFHNLWSLKFPSNLRVVMNFTIDLVPFCGATKSQLLFSIPMQIQYDSLSSPLKQFNHLPIIQNHLCVNCESFRELWSFPLASCQLFLAIKMQIRRFHRAAALRHFIDLKREQVWWENEWNEGESERQERERWTFEKKRVKIFI